MKSPRRNSKPALARLWFIAACLLFGANPSSAENVILHLRNGDRIQGAILSENTNVVVLGTTWIKELPVPASAILRRESVTNPPPPTATAPQAATPPAPPKTTNAVPPAPAAVAAKPPHRHPSPNVGRPLSTSVPTCSSARMTANCSTAAPS